ncbi:MAG: hypothetical protein GYB65_03520, partial [Chloroflexi bacterium]|nr:hypothetical protein [Chloroflexota bacterium]
PPPDPRYPPDVGEEVDELSAELEQAQQELEELKASASPSKKAGLFTRIKAVLELQKQIDALVKEYPGLMNT